MKRFLLSAALLAAATTAIQAHTLDGVVKDNKTGEPLIGTVIRVKELPNVSTTTKFSSLLLRVVVLCWLSLRMLILRL